MDLLLTLWLGVQAPTTPAAPDPLPVSLERIRRGLDGPPDPFARLTVTEGLPSVFFVKVEEELLDYERLWREATMVPTYVRPTRNLYQHEFLGSVTPDIFRGTAQHPCCDVVPLMEYVGRQVRGAYRKYLRVEGPARSQESDRGVRGLHEGAAGRQEVARQPISRSRSTGPSWPAIDAKTPGCRTGSRHRSDGRARRTRASGKCSARCCWSPR